MSTFFNEETQQYENFEAAIVRQLTRIDGLMSERAEETEEEAEG